MPRHNGLLLTLDPQQDGGKVRPDQWNCSSSVEPERALTEDEPPWITVVTSSK
jgi:hypothetical protein